MAEETTKVVICFKCMLGNCSECTRLKVEGSCQHDCEAEGLLDEQDEEETDLVVGLKG